MLLLLVFCGAALACGALLSFNVLQTRFRRQLESAEATWHLRHQQDSPGTVIENVSVGWLNLLLQSLWTPVLGKHASGLTTELLSKVFAEVLEKHSQRSPWKYLESISIEGLSFGTVPPAFQVMSAKFDPTASMLTFSTDVRFTTNGAQAVLLVCSKTVGPIAPVTVRLEVTHVKLRGRLRLGVLLGQEAPGIQGVYYSFTSPPQLDVAVRPLGLPLPSVLPGVDTALRGVLSKLVGRRMVEPQRRYLDVHRIYLNKHIARVGGPGGLLRVIVVNASSLCTPGQQQQQTLPAAAVGNSPDAQLAYSKKGSSKSAAAGTSSDAAKLSAFCEVRFGPTVLRTPIAHLAGAALADWSYQFSLPLPFELDAWPAAQAAGAGGGSSSSCGVAAGGAAGSGSAASQRASAAAGSDATDPNLYLSVFDAQTVGQPVLLGKTKVTLGPLQLQPNGPARTLVLPLQKASNSRAAVQLHVQWLKSTKRPSAQDAAGAPRRMQQQGRRVVGTPPSLTQAPQAQAPSPQPVPRSASAFAVSSKDKAVSWQDKTSLRVKSATAAAKKSMKELVRSKESVSRSGSSSSGSGKLQHAADAVAAEGGAAAAASTAAGDTAVAGPGQHDGSAGPWSAADHRPPSPAGSDGQQGAAAAGAGDASPVAAAARGQQDAAAAAAPDLDVQQAGVPAAAGASGSSSLLAGWLGSWIWSEASAQEPASASASPTPTRQASTRHVSVNSPWAMSVWEDADEDEEGWDGRQESVGGLSNSSSSPLALLSHVVLLQKELEQQRAALSTMQQQLDHTSNSYQRLKQVCRQRGRAALLQGARFVLHKADGSTQHVLLYLTHAGSSRGVQPSRLGRQPQQPQQPEQGLLLAIAALPETRSEARSAFKRLAAGTGEGPAVGDDSNHSAHARASSAGGELPHPQGGRLSAFGSVGAGLRLRLQQGTILQSGYDSGKLPRSALQLLKTVPARQLVGVVRGNRHFSVPASGSGGSSSSAGGHGGPAGAECFTVMVQEDGGGQVTAINLQLPLVGNGRNLDEWLLAVRDVASAGHQQGAAAAAVGHQTAAQGQPSGAVQEAVGTSTAGGGPGQGAAADAAAGEACSSAGHSGPGVAEQAAAAVARDPPLSYKVDSPAQQQQHAAVEPAADWMLPAAASATPRPWAGGAAAAYDVGGASGGTDDDDNAETDDTD